MDPLRGHVLISLFLSLFEYPPQEFVANGKLTSVETKWTSSMCPRRICLFTRFWEIPSSRTVTRTKLGELELIISIDTLNASAAASIAWLSTHSLSFHNDNTKCWVPLLLLLIRDSVYNSGFCLLQPGV